jgi:uncharacterized protein YdhG (YjbR/CyaY superfamily)
MQSSVKDIDSYIEQHPEGVRIILEELRQTIQKAVPGAEELISYQMPAFRFHGRLVWFAAFKNHYSIFFRQNVLQSFKEELKSFELSKSESAIKIPFDKPVPVQLLTRIVQSGAKANLDDSQLKTKGRK